MQAPINSNKHFVNRVSVAVASGNVLNMDIIDTVNAPAVASSNQVRVGAIIKAVWVELWISSQAAANVAQFVLTLMKLPAGLTAPTFSNLANLGAFPNKKNIFYTTQGNVSASNVGANTVPIVRQFFLIPKGKQRFGLGDKLTLSITATAEGLLVCGMNIYKEYT